MDFFERLNSILTEVGKEAEQKVKEVSDNVRLNTKIREEKAAIKECMEKIGRMYYEEQKGEGTGIYQETFDQIQKSREAIRKAQKELEELKKKTTCQSCGAPMQKEDLFCSRCGAKREEDMWTEEEQEGEAETQTEKMPSEEKAEPGQQETSVEEGQETAKDSETHDETQE